MAIAVRGSAADGSTNPTTSFTITIPAATQAGDVCVVVGISRDSVTASGVATCTDDDTGGNTWTLAGASPLTAGGEFNNFVYYKIATSGTASKTVTVANCVGSSSGGMVVFSGAYTAGSPITDLAFELNLSSDETMAGFTPDVADSMICALVTVGNSTALPTVMACTDPGSLEPELWQATSTGGNDCSATFFAVVQAGGPTATGDFTWTQTNAAGFGAVFAVRPEAAAFTGRHYISPFGWH